MNQYRAGDFVLVDNQIKGRTEVGKIEEVDERSFQYAIYYRPEDTNMGRQQYHSMKELFKTTDLEKEDIDNILSKCEVYKLKRYLKCSGEEKFSDRTYFFRQTYDPMTHRFSPDLEPECFCGRFINPDDEIVECSGVNCEKLYHYTCITFDNNNCLACRSQLTSEDGGDAYKKIKVDSETSIALTGTGRNMYEEMKNAMKNDGIKMAPLSISRRVTQNMPENNKPKTESRKRRVFPNISEAKEEKILKKIDEFSRSNSTKNMTDNEKTRQKTRESLYKFLLYGYEELKERNAMAENLKSTLTEERKLLSFSENKAYEHALNVAREVEATIYAYFKGDFKRYLPKVKILVQFLIHEKNYELRVKILAKRMTAQEICVAKDQDLAPSSVNKMIEHRKEELLKESMLREEKIIAKTHKGETVLEGMDFPEEAAKKDKFDAPATVFETETKIIEEEDSEENDEDNYYIGKENYGGNEHQYHYGMSPGPGMNGDKGAHHKANRDDFLSRPHLTNTKFFDQNLRKMLKENLIEKTYIRLQDRFNNFLKGKIKQNLVDSLDRAIDKISNSA